MPPKGKVIFTSIEMDEETDVNIDSEEAVNYVIHALLDNVQATLYQRKIDRMKVPYLLNWFFDQIESTSKIEKTA